MSKIQGNFGGNQMNEEQMQMQQMEAVLQMLKNSTAVECENCKSNNFINVYKLRKVSGLVNGSGRDQFIPVPVFACADCGHVNRLFLKSSGIPEDDKVEKEKNNDENVSSPIIKTPNGE